ncbi:hypothetical protein [Microlunatus ginsengisoli]|uniref:Uncharacterized protein n=1 Tax=Microlunatus ginsengisoli TaxID=363863 RepID=A0ABP7AHG4_9ACTN
MSGLMPLAGGVDLSGAWSTFWNAVSSSGGAQLTNVLSVVGVAVLVLAFASFFWQRARHNNKGVADGGKLWWAIGIGAVLSAPGVIFPILLTFVDVIANAVISVYNATQ